MTLFNLSLRNVKKNFYNYLIYFVSMIFSIVIYFTFTSIRYNEQVLDVSSKMVKLGSVFKASAIIIAIFVAIFIWYSNSFFTRKRKKEIGLYSLMGLKKNQIGRMLFYENILMGALALAIGIVLGGLLSKLFVMLLFSLMGLTIDVKFAISSKAVLNTTITFAILFFITSIHGYTIIYRFKLIDLFKAESTGEKAPKASKILAILSIIFILGGYKIYLDIFDSDFQLRLLLTLVFVVIGTYLFFSSFVVFVVKLKKKNKKHFYNGINMIGVSQLAYRIKGNSRTLATIAILSATTLTAMGVSTSLSYSLKVDTETSNPFSYVSFVSDKNFDKEVQNIMKKHPKNKLMGSVEVNPLKATGSVPNMMKSKTFNDPGRDSTYSIISESKFNEIAKLRNLDYEINLKSADEVVLFDQSYFETFMNSYTNKILTLKGANGDKKLKIVDFKTYPLIYNSPIATSIVVKDEVYKSLYNEKDAFYVKVYKTDNERNSKALTEELVKLANNYKVEESDINVSGSSLLNYYSAYRSGLAVSGLLIFISSFLGLVFLLATGSIIFFKQLSEASDDKERYTLLKKIGITKKEIKRSISKQLLFVFLLPLVLGIAHSLVAVSALKVVLKINLLIPLSTSIAAYIVIYMFYYLLTVSSYNKIVNNSL